MMIPTLKIKLRNALIRGFINYGGRARWKQLSDLAVRYGFSRRVTQVLNEMIDDGMVLKLGHGRYELVALHYSPFAPADDDLATHELVARRDVAA